MGWRSRRRSMSRHLPRWGWSRKRQKEELRRKKSEPRDVFHHAALLVERVVPTACLKPESPAGEKADQFDLSPRLSEAATSLLRFADKVERVVPNALARAQRIELGTTRSTTRNEFA